MRRGYATLTASAFVEHAAGLGITPYWDSWKANLPSVAVARKVGFRLLTEYNVFTGRLRLLPE
jgi:RimJ/RimL family protein N-acetyltransferase